MQCAVCNLPGLVFPCYRCGGSFCGRCVARHGGRDCVFIEEEVADRILDEVAAGMHTLWLRVAQKEASEVASDPAAAAVNAARKTFVCW